VQEFSRFEPEWDGFWESTRGDYRMTTARTSRYLNWRYVDCPGLRYRLFQAKEGGAVQGFVVTRQREAPEYRSTRIVDLWCRRGDARTVLTLAGKALEFCAKDCAFVEAVTSDAAVLRAYRRLGFLPMGRQPLWAGGTQSGTPDAAQALGEWYAALGDHDWDQFRPVGPG
jgi:hypothetical protein